MKNIIFFDGICLLCNGFVDMLLRLDKKRKLYYAPLQGKTAQTVLNASHRQLDMVAFQNSNGLLFVKSTAIIEIFNNLGGTWKVFTAFRILPRIFRDWVYDVIAGHRYQIFGKRKSCRMPSPDTEGQILP